MYNNLFSNLFPVSVFPWAAHLKLILQAEKVNNIGVKCLCMFLRIISLFLLQKFFLIKWLHLTQYVSTAMGWLPLIKHDLQ